MKTYERLRRISSDLKHVGSRTSNVIEQEIIAIARAELESMAIELEGDALARETPPGVPGMAVEVHT